MRRLFLSVSLGAALLLGGCAAFVPVLGSMAVGITSQAALEKGATERRADRCYKLTKSIEARGLGKAEAARERTKQGCPLNS